MQDKFVFFDLGNVLVHFDHDIAVRNVANLVSRDTAVVKQALFTSGLQDRLETGLITSHEFAESVVKTLDCKTDKETLLEAISAIFRPNEGIVILLDQLRQARIPMAVLSNTCEPHWLWILRQQWPVMHGWFDFYILSFEARSMKPDAGIYVESERRSGRKPEQLFFTDDRADNIAAARARGWATHQFHFDRWTGKRTWAMVGNSLACSRRQRERSATGCGAIDMTRVRGIYRWTDCGYLRGWRIQAHYRDGSFRLLDPRGYV